MYICNSSVALKVAHITDLCNHACRILDALTKAPLATTSYILLLVENYQKG